MLCALSFRAFRRSLEDFTLAHHSKRQQCLILESGQISEDAIQLLLIFAIVGFLFEETNTLVRESKGSKHERLGLALEVLLLGFLAVLVHYISDGAEVNQKLFASTFQSFLLSLLNEGVSLRVPVREQNHHHSQNNQLLLFRVEARVIRQDILPEDVVNETLNYQVHLIL